VAAAAVVAGGVSAGLGDVVPGEDESGRGDPERVGEAIDLAEALRTDALDDGADRGEVVVPWLHEVRGDGRGVVQPHLVGWERCREAPVTVPSTPLRPADDVHARVGHAKRPSPSPTQRAAARISLRRLSIAAASCKSRVSCTM
jgi:hypothetical protein